MIRNSKGSASVFLVFILSSMIMLVVAFIYATSQSAIKSSGDSLLNVAGRAVLSEFDLDLKKDYGIFAFVGGNSDIEKKVSKYVGYTINSKKGMNLESVDAKTSDYCLLNVDVFNEKIASYMKYAKARDLLDSLTEKKDTDKPEGITRSTRVLRNETVSGSLPGSYISGKGIGLSDLKEFVSNGISNIDGLFSSGTETCLVNDYIMTHFKNMHNQDVGHDTFFSNEVEYILEGELDDDQNRRKVRTDIIAVREACNLASIYRDGVLYAETVAFAEALSLGHGEKATVAAVAAAWALMESENDMKLLEKGEKVATLKNKKTWATDIESAWEGITKGVSSSESDSGMDYEDYLKLMLLFQSRTNKTVRIMDLIQINMKGNYNRGFLMGECNCGFHLDACINGEKYAYEEKY